MRLSAVVSMCLDNSCGSLSSVTIFVLSRATCIDAARSPVDSLSSTITLYCKDSCHITEDC